MSIDATAWAFRQRGIPPVEKLCLLMLADFHDPRNGGHVSLTYLCEQLELERDDVIAAVASLMRRRMISVPLGKTNLFPEQPLCFDMPVDD